MHQPRTAQRRHPAASLLRRVAPSLALLAPAAAYAHPGHDGGFLAGLLHPFHGLDHLLAAVAVGVWGARLGGRAAWMLPAAFVGAMLLGGAAGYAGLGLPMSEIVIALSVMLLGLAIAADTHVAASLGAGLVAAFALFHGGAHGAEAPATAFAGYALGLALATLALHTSGIAAALALRARPRLLRIAGAPVALAGVMLLAGRLQ